MANVFEMCDYNHEKSSFTSCYYEVNYDCEAVSLRVSTSGRCEWVRKTTALSAAAYLHKTSAMHWRSWATMGTLS